MKSTWNNNPVKRVNNIDVNTNLRKLEDWFEIISVHRKMLIELGSEFVYAKRCIKDNKKYGIALVRFSGQIENTFGITREVLFFYSEFVDLQTRTYNKAISEIKSLNNSGKRTVTEDLLFLHSPDKRLAEKLADWNKNSSVRAIPLSQYDTSDSINIIELLKQNIYVRDLFYETKSVGGSDFFGRDKAVQELESDIFEKRVSGIFGLRKMGKTSLLNKIRENLPSNFICIYIDLEDLPALGDTTALSLCSKIIRGIDKSLSSQKNKISVKAIKEFIQNPSVNSFGDTLNSIIQKLASIDNRLIIQLDEIEYLIPSDKNQFVPEISQIFGVLRSAVQENNNFLFTVAGLASEIFEEDSFHGRINPLFSWGTTRWLGPFEKHEADTLARTLSNKMGLEISESGLEKLYEATGGHAFLYRTLASAASKLVPISTHKRQISGSTVLQAIEDWRLEIAGNIKQIFNQLSAYYPLESLLLDSLLNSLVQFLEDSVQEPQALNHLIKLGLIYKDGSNYQPNVLLELY